MTLSESTSKLINLTALWVAGHFGLSERPLAGTAGALARSERCKARSLFLKIALRTIKDDRMLQFPCLWRRRVGGAGARGTAKESLEPGN